MSKHKDFAIPEEVVLNKIYLIRGIKVMLDKDLASLYQVETKRLKESVKRNIQRFPQDFMFELTQDEFIILRSQFATSSWDGARYPPYAFTEQGFAMLSSVLNSDRAIAVNIEIIRIFTKMRKIMMTNKDILLKLEQLEKRDIQRDDDIKVIFNYLKELFNPSTLPIRKIGIKRNDED